MNSSYEFLPQLERLRSAYTRFESALWLLNAAIISTAFYAVTLLLGLPAFTKFYWQDIFLLAQLPAVISIAFGLHAANLIKQRRRADFYTILGPDLSEKARAAYDNRASDTIFMQHLAAELRASLAAINPSRILQWRLVNTRVLTLAIATATTIFIAQSQISADITPADLRSLSDLKDQVQGIFGEKPQPHVQNVNLSGEIYGKPSLATLQENKLQLELYPGLSPGSKTTPSEQVNRNFQQSQAVEASAVPSQLYIESLPPQNKEIVKRYFESLASS